MKFYYLLLSAALLFPAVCFSQGNFKPGYVITLKGDTLKGFISEHEWDSNPRFVSFKAKGIDEAKKFTVADIGQFTIDSALTYKRFICHISLGTTDENHLAPKDTTTKLDTVFLEVLQSGKNLSLFSYSDNIKTRFFVSEKNDAAPHELLYRVYVWSNTSAANDVRNKTDNVFIQQLGSLALKYGKLTDKLQKTLDHLEYREHSIVKVVSAINDIDKPALVKKKKNYAKLVLASALFVVIAGLVISKM
ncbi:hypothetical protein EWM62_17070 [Mucilaginibacter terrigena]|uniref:DUF4369 domain-containing protein n=1 Tax=Mucilaginibacter terrigena TaxID=2492395 RepID=A0A4Q5LHG8_9SPHI|nr:hypothetical protein [Mucilaginibacter terrigena]RYU86863.1 hypothetical protein EWM62_17070 [Mucilaginibacter terrigena]